MRYAFGLFAFAAALCWPAVAGAGVADNLFDESGKDFGPVPRGPTLEHVFRMVNRSRDAIHITNVRVSCGCTQAQATKEWLSPGEEGAVVARMDTRRFSGSKAVTIFVTLDRPEYDEARLVVQAYGRDDIGISPDSFAFGRVRRGGSPDADVVVRLGSPGWRVLSAHADSGYVRVKARPVNGDDTAYRLEARLRPDTPVGSWYTDVWVDTNDPQTPRLRVPLTVDVEPALSVSPQLTDLGQVKQGAEIERRVVVRGDAPFKVVGVDGADGQIAVNDSTPEARAMHVLIVRLKAQAPGAVTRTFQVHTDLKEEPVVTFQATATVTR